MQKANAKACWYLLAVIVLLAASGLFRLRWYHSRLLHQTQVASAVWQQREAEDTRACAIFEIRTFLSLEKYGFVKPSPLNDFYPEIYKELKYDLTFAIQRQVAGAKPVVIFSFATGKLENTPPFYEGDKRPSQEELEATEAKLKPLYEKYLSSLKGCEEAFLATKNALEELQKSGKNYWDFRRRLEGLCGPRATEILLSGPREWTEWIENTIRRLQSVLWWFR